MIDFKQLRYGQAEDGTIAVVLSDVAHGLRRMKDDNRIVTSADLRETMRWAADFLDEVEQLLPSAIGRAES